MDTEQSHAPTDLLLYTDRKVSAQKKMLTMLVSICACGSHFGFGATHMPCLLYWLYTLVFLFQSLQLLGVLLTTLQDHESYKMHWNSMKLCRDV